MNPLGTCQTCTKSRMLTQLGGYNLTCCAEPPQLVVVSTAAGPKFISMFPLVEASGWCAQCEIPQQDRLRVAS